MAEIVKIESHYNDMLDRLPMQFRDKPVIEAMLSVWFEAVQEIEDDLDLMRVSTRLLSAEGVQLDRYGKVLGLTRDFNESDGQFFGRIATRLISRASDGSTEGLQKVTEAITGLSNTNVIEFNNPVEWENNNVDLLTGGVLVYGEYSDQNSNLANVNVDVISGACVAGIGSTVFGRHLNTNASSSLWIPCEVILEGDDLVYRDIVDVIDNAVDELGNQIVVNANNFARFGDRWENAVLPEDDIQTEDFTINAGSLDTFSVDTGSGAQQFKIAKSGIDLKGIMLEVATTF